MVVPLNAENYPDYFDVRFTHDNTGEWPHAFVILTAWATTGETWEERRNLDANVRLKSRLEDDGIFICSITGRSPLSGHAEPGFAVRSNTHEGCALGREYLQHAIYVVEGDDLYVCACHDEQLVYVDSFRKRLDR